MAEWIVISLLFTLMDSCFGDNIVKFSANPGVNFMPGSFTILGTLQGPSTYCAVRCQKNSFCGGFIYHSGAGQCDLLEGKPTQAQLQASPGDMYYESKSGYECYLTDKGEDYMGTRSVTEHGLTCQRWDSQSPHVHTLTSDDLYPDATRSDANNYCRNPSKTVRPWCYTTDPNTRWQYCNLHKCP